MSNKTETARKGRFSNFLANRKQAPKNFNFVKEHQGSVHFVRIETGAYKCEFKSRMTGRTAFAYGQSVQRSYAKMIELFNLKYNV